jgi:hypothetical protein
MMTYPDYEQAKEYRDRLLSLIEEGRKILPAKGLESFSRSILGKVQQLEKDMAIFEKSSSGSMCVWFGLRTFNVTAQINRDASRGSSNIRWNSPIEQAGSVPATVKPSQGNLLPEQDNALLLDPLPA